LGKEQISGHTQKRGPTNAGKGRNTHTNFLDEKRKREHYNAIFSSEGRVGSRKEQFGERLMRGSTRQAPTQEKKSSGRATQKNYSYRRKYIGTAHRTLGGTKTAEIRVRDGKHRGASREERRV